MIPVTTPGTSGVKNMLLKMTSHISHACVSSPALVGHRSQSVVAHNVLYLTSPLIMDDSLDTVTTGHIHISTRLLHMSVVKTGAGES